MSGWGAWGDCAGGCEGLRAPRSPPPAHLLGRLLCLPAPGAAVLDAGCGNGKYLGVPGCEALRVFGCDISLGLLEVCVKRGHDVVRANALRLPYRPAAFDAAVSIAVLHHISSPSRRRAAVDEIVRALRPGGRALITVWRDCPMRLPCFLVVHSVDQACIHDSAFTYMQPVDPT